MGFSTVTINDKGEKTVSSMINDEHKLRLSLSLNAQLKMSEDMDTFKVSKAATFINTVFDNFKYEAKSSISLYLQQRELELDRLLTDSDLDEQSKNIVIDKLLEAEEKELEAIKQKYKSEKGNGKLYHINEQNYNHLTYDSDESKYYDNRPSLYVRAVLEEYCSLPFIERERIYRKDIYEKIERACAEKRILKVKVNYTGSDQLFYVYPYKIVPDPSHTQSYLTCYSRRAENSEKDRIIASFSMARINDPTVLMKTFRLSQKEKDDIDRQISKCSPAYLVGTPDLITIRLTEKGKQIYHSRIYARPERVEADLPEDVYLFNCTHQQIFNFFFSFGPEAEILSPENLRERFRSTLAEALRRYS